MLIARWLAAIVLVSSCLGAACQTKVRFTATVVGGQSYARTIRQGLVFVVEPDNRVGGNTGEWSHMDVKSTRESETSFADCVTYPLHGPTVLDLAAWEWAPNRPMGTEMLHRREFSFVLNSVDNDKACAEKERVSEDLNSMTESVGTPGYKAPPRGAACVVIRSIQMKAPNKDGELRFARIVLDVEITLPKAAKLPGAEKQSGK